MPAGGACLIVIDMQRFFIDPISHASFPQAEAIVPNVGSILNAFRQAGLPVVFTRHALLFDEDPGLMGQWWRDVLRDDDPLSAIDRRVAPLSGERVLRKTRYSAFVRTKLEALLEERRVERLVIAGVQTHLCCESTARDAFMRDINVTVVEDAVAAKDDGLHSAGLKVLASGFATLATAKEVVEWLRAGK